MEKKQLKYQTAWHRMGDALIKPGGEYGQTVIMNPCVVKKEKDIYLFYASADESNRRNIRLIIFKDGDFSQPQYKGVMIPNGPWGSFDGAWNVLPMVVKVKEKWHMYYTGNSGMGIGLANFPGLGLATSEDLIHWEKYPGGPVLAPSGIAGTPDCMGIAGGAIVTLPDGTLRWYYVGCPTVGTEHFLDQQKYACVAESKDGIHWERKGAVIERDPQRDYKDIATPPGGTCIQEDSLYKMWYPCIGTRWGFYSICYGESEDGLNWNIGECYADELAFGPRTRHLDMEEPYHMWDSQMVSYPAVFDKDGKRYMFYCGNAYGVGGLGLAVACNSRVYARGTELFAMYKGERYDVSMDVTVNGKKLPKTDWSKPDSDCNIWTESVIDDVTVRLILTHTVEGIRVFCTAISQGKEADVTVEVQFGTLARGADGLRIEKMDTKTAKVDIVL